MADRRAKFTRLLRVRSLQLGQVRVQEVEAQARLVQEQGLRDRIAQLSAGVAPAPAPVRADTLAASAFYRERLQQSAASAAHRVAVAEARVANARTATREARRDQTAVEKLLARAEGEAMRKAMRALEELPPAARKRHDPC